MTDGARLAAASDGPLDPYCALRPRFLGLADANAALSSVDNDCRNGWRSRLLRMTDGGVAALYAPDHVYWEIYEYLPRISRSGGVPVDILRQRYESAYLPALRFVSMSDEDITDPQVLMITDVDDVPLGQLAKLVAPCVVFSEDRHLRRPGLAPPDWRHTAECAVYMADGCQKQQAMSMAAVAPTRVLVELVSFAGRKTGLPPWLVGVGLAGAAAYILRKPERREFFWEHVLPSLETLSNFVEAAVLLEQVGQDGLRKAMLQPPRMPTARQKVAIVLSRQRGPTTAYAVQTAIQRHFPADAVPTMTEIRVVLTSGSEFVEGRHNHWQFGRLTAPWRPKGSVAA